MEIYQRIRKAVRLQLLRSQAPCRELVPLMSQSLERKLALRERLRLRLHLIVCAWCVRYLKQLRLLRQLVRLQSECTAEEALPNVSLTSEARARIAKSINNQ